MQRVSQHPEWGQDGFAYLGDVSWADYERLLRMRGERSKPRIQYLDGTVEIMSPSDSHEGIASVIGCLVEAWCDVNDVDFSPYGNWTIRKRGKRGGVEPDECYFIGELKLPRRRPDLAIEVIWTSGGLDKLEIYRRLRVPEVWIWEESVVSVYGLHGKKYRKLRKSRLLPGIDLVHLASFVDLNKMTSRVIRAYRRALMRK